MEDSRSDTKADVSELEIDVVWFVTSELSISSSRSMSSDILGRSEEPGVCNINYAIIMMHKQKTKQTQGMHS